MTGLQRCRGRSVGWLAAGAIAWLLIAQPGQAACDFFSEPQRYNTETEGDVIVIGGQPDQRYRVVVAGTDAATLSAIRACVLDAFVTRSRTGSYIQAGSFANRSDAETIRRILQGEGYRTRVIYRR